MPAVTSPLTLDCTCISSEQEVVCQHDDVSTFFAGGKLSSFVTIAFLFFPLDTADTTSMCAFERDCMGGGETDSKGAVSFTRLFYFEQMAQCTGADLGDVCLKRFISCKHLLLTITDFAIK